MNSSNQLNFMKEKNNNISKSENISTSLYWNTLLRFPSRGIYFIISIIIARILMPVDFGIMGIAMMTILYANIITNFGFNEAIIQKKITEIKLINSIFTVDIIISIFFTGIFFFIAGSMASFFNSPESENAIKVLSSLFILTTFHGITKAILRRDMDFKTLSVMDLLQTLLSSITTLILALYNFKYWALIYGQIISYMIMTFILCKKTGWVPFFHYSHSMMKKVYDFGKWNFVKSQIIYTTKQIDKIIIGRFLGPASLGIYEKAMSIALIPLESFTRNINAVMFSSFSKQKDNIVELQNQFKKTLTLISLTNFPIYFGLSAVAPYFVYVLLGDKWAPMIQPFQIILFACILGSIAGLIASLNVGMGYYKKHTILCALSLLVFIISCFLLLQFKLNGISLSYLIFVIAVTVSTLSLAISKINISWKAVIYSLYPGLLGSGLMYSLVKVISRYYLTEYSIQNIIILIGIGSITYFLYLYMDRTDLTNEFKNRIREDIWVKIAIILRKGITCLHRLFKPSI